MSLSLNARRTLREKKKTLQGDFLHKGLLNHKYICNTISVDVIRFGRIVEICRLSSFLSLGLLPDFEAARKRLEISTNNVYLHYFPNN